MTSCTRCGSFAINHHLHGRDGSYPKLCDVCHWRNQSESNRILLALSQARVRELEDMLDDASVIPRQPEIDGAP